MEENKKENLKKKISDWWVITKWDVKNKCSNARQWCEEHPELAIAMIPAGIAAIRGTTSVVRSVDRKIDMNRQQKLMDERIYVPSLHKHVKLKRPMTIKETVEYDRRKSEGESIVAILYDMDLLK